MSAGWRTGPGSTPHRRHLHRNKALRNLTYGVGSYKRMLAYRVWQGLAAQAPAPQMVTQCQKRMWQVFVQAAAALRPRLSRSSPYILRSPTFMSPPVESRARVRRKMLSL